MIDPIVVEFVVEASPERAFRTWTERGASWWPPSHTYTEGPGYEVVFEPHAGGRIFERRPDGSEDDWGTITRWDPPNLVEYRWHIFVEPEQATTVVVTFADLDGRCLVRLENSGFEVFGDGASPRKVRVAGAWEIITASFAAAF